MRTKYYSDYNMEENEIGGHMARVGHNTNTYGCLVNTLEGKRLLGKMGR